MNDLQKYVIDNINALFSEQKYFEVNQFSKSAESLHHYPGIVLIEGTEAETPYAKKNRNLFSQ